MPQSLYVHLTRRMGSSSAGILASTIVTSDVLRVWCYFLGVSESIKTQKKNGDDEMYLQATTIDPELSE